ncbi:MAG: tRNA pseudouridine(38-40) synthase TruA [Phycisphaerales bacterium]|nr:tRNA pseudouridine(38-40) synthase TruA [Phycisphaerales bacterium]
MERNIRLVISYDGTDFHGWQAQPGLRTVQGEIESVALRVVRHPLSIRGSGRTDAGVHARGQVANFHTTCEIPTDNLRRAIQARLPLDVSLRRADEVHPDFVASASATSKLYRYRIHNSTHRPVDGHTQRHTYHCWHALDVARMQEAATHFIGEMDYSAMAGAGCVRETMVRRVLRCDIHRHFEEVRVDVAGTGFLYNQVRNMVGTLIEIGRGRWEPDRLRTILASLDRRQAGPTAPAQGLSLQWVRYPPELLQPVESNTAIVPR